MIKNDFQGGGLVYLCDRCNTILSKWPEDKSRWVKANSRNRNRSNYGDKGRVMYFCDEKCKTIFFKGKKSYRKKMEYKAKFIKKMDVQS